MQATLAIARLTAANGLRQPLTWLTVGLGATMLVLSAVFGMFTFLEEDRLRLLMTAGVAATLLIGLFLAVVGASNAVHDELASRTALTLFAKPIGRGHFLLGKVLGCWTVAAVGCLCLALMHLGLVALINSEGFRIVDVEALLSRRQQAQVSDAAIIQVPWWRLIAAHLLTLGHTWLIACLSATLALRLPLVANVLASFAIFVASNVLAGLGLGHQLGGILPLLALFNIDEALQFSALPLSPAYFLLCLGYALSYGAGLLLLGLAWFGRHDIP